MKKRGAGGPYKVVNILKPWGNQPYLVDCENRICGQLNMSGNAKQRRQQRRKLIRDLNQE